MWRNIVPRIIVRTCMQNGPITNGGIRARDDSPVRCRIILCVTLILSCVEKFESDESVSKVLFTNRFRWQNFCPNLLGLEDTVIQKTQKTRTKVLPSASAGEEYFSTYFLLLESKFYCIASIEQYIDTIFISM